MSEAHPLNQEYTNDEIKQKVLSNEITADDFFKFIDERDQSTLERIGAIENIRLLSDPQIAERFAHEAETNFDYYEALSFANFHIGQNLAIEGKNAEALSHFKASYEAAMLVEEDPEYYKNWTLYVQGTIAYFEKDLVKLESIFTDMPTSRNKEVIGNLIEGLETTGSIDYKLAYSK